jgi:hypothetical protein
MKQLILYNTFASLHGTASSQNGVIKWLLINKTYVSSPVDSGRELEEMMAQILQNSYPPAAGKNKFNF